VRKAGDDAEVRLVVRRGGEVQEVKARLGPPDGAAGTGGANRFGVTVGPGVVVAEVLPDTPASKAGVTRGDVIDDVNGTAVHTGAQLRDLVQHLPAGGEAALRLTRLGKQKAVRVRVDGNPEKRE
jgi:S1-C subfamily serine protease